MLIPDPESVDADVALLNEGHAQPDQSRSLAGHVDLVGREDDLAVEAELVFGLGETGDQGGEPGAHAPEHELVTNLLEELWSVTAALLDELDDLQIAGAFGVALLVLGRAGVHPHVGLLDFLDHQGPENRH